MRAEKSVPMGSQGWHSTCRRPTLTKRPQGLGHSIRALQGEVCLSQGTWSSPELRPSRRSPAHALAIEEVGTPAPSGNHCTPDRGRGPGRGQ